MTQLELFPTNLRLTRIDPARNMRRFYRLALQPDLFGGCTLIREWGRIGRGGQMKLEGFPSEGHAVDALLAVKRRKTQRGYLIEAERDRNSEDLRIAIFGIDCRDCTHRVGRLRQP